MQYRLVTRRCRVGFILLLMPLILLSGCQTLREVANLREVDFALDQVTDARLAGVEISRIRSYQDLRITDIGRVGSALANGELPLQFDLHVLAKNPAENQFNARMVQMDWTLFMNNRETISGVLNQRFVLTPGEARSIPLHLELDLLDFFEGGARDLIELALAVTGQGPGPEQIRLEATPTIETPVGPIQYPQPITITYDDFNN